MAVGADAAVPVMLAALCWIAGWLISSALLSARLNACRDAMTASRNVRTRLIVYCRYFVTVPIYATYLHLAFAAVFSKISSSRITDLLYSSTLIFDRTNLFSFDYIGACTASTLVSVAAVFVSMLTATEITPETTQGVTGAAFFAWLVAFLFLIALNLSNRVGKRSKLMYIVLGSVVVAIVIASAVAAGHKRVAPSTTPAVPGEPETPRGSASQGD